MTPSTRPRGRPAGSLNKVAINKTRVISEFTTTERIKAYLDKLDAMLLDDNTTPSDFIKGLSLLLKYVAVTADSVIESETIAEIGSKEEADKILSALKTKLNKEHQE